MLQAMETAFPASLLFHVGTINVPPNINLDYIIMWEPSPFLQPQPLHIFDCFSLFLSFSFYRVFFLTGTPPKSSKYKKVNLGRGIGVSRPTYVNVDTPNLGFPYFNFLGGYQLKKNTLY